jgi:hypothetical protein
LSRVVAVILFIVASILEFVEIKPRSRRVALRRDVASSLSGTIFGLMALLTLLGLI